MVLGCLMTEEPSLLLLLRASLHHGNQPPRAKNSGELTDDLSLLVYNGTFACTADADFATAAIPGLAALPGKPKAVPKLDAPS